MKGAMPHFALAPQDFSFYTFRVVRVLHTYVISRVAVTALASIIVLTLILVLGNAFKRIFEVLANNDVPLYIIVKMIVLLIPQVLTFTVPWGLLMGVLIVMGRMSHDNELQAVYSSGIGLIPLIAPIILLSLIVTLFCFYNNAALAPSAMTDFKLQIIDLGRNNPTAFVKAGEPITQFSGYRLYIGKKNATMINDVFIWETRSDGIPHRSIRAERGSIAADLEQLSLTLTLYNVRQDERADGPPSLNHIQSGMRAQQLPITISLKDALDANKIDENISINTLGKLSSKLFNRRLPQVNVMPLLTELQKRVAFSFAPFTFILVGIPLALQFRRRETSVGLVLSLGIAITYYLIVILAMALKEKAGAYPDLIVWLPNIIFQGLGFFLLWRANYKQY